MPQLHTPRFGAWITLNSALVAEQVARLGFDFVVIDAQHGLLGYADMRDALLGLTAGGCQLPLARVSENSPGEIGKVLDAGAQGVIIPMVNSAEEARAAARAARYAPSGGQRSYSPVRYGSHLGVTPSDTDDNVLVLPMIETREGLDAVEEILETPGIDGVFVGPYDLSLGLGASIPFEERVRPKLEAALARILEAATQRDKIAGVYCGDGASAVARARQGFTLVNTSHDMSAIREAMGAQLAHVAAQGLCSATRLEHERRYD